jgi:photosystem II stability/assembly factor-like uncharacterized protein
MKHMNVWYPLVIVLLTIWSSDLMAQPQAPSAMPESILFNSAHYQALEWRNIGPFRGGRSVAVAGHPENAMVYYMGTTGGGVWKTTDAGLSWTNISDGFLKTGSVGAIAVSEANPNIIYVGMGEHAVRGVMTSHGDGMYRTDDGGKTWDYLGLPNTRHIAEIQIHPKDPNVVYVAVQGALHGPSEDRGIYRTLDGGKSWEKVFYINNTTGASDLSMDVHNPRILYAGMWDHERKPWTVRSGGPGSGLYKSTDGGANWTLLTKGLPEAMGKTAVAVSRANPELVFANIEAEKGGVFKSTDGGETWEQTSSDRVTIARAWYYIEVFPDPVDTETVYVLNAPMLRSVDGGKNFSRIANPHGDQHDMWINPKNPDNIILGNDGGACITFNGGKTWSTQGNQPTAQFYRVITDNRFPYYVYGGQQDNSTMAIASRTLGAGISAQDWYPVAGGESAFLAFDPNDPTKVYGGSYQGNLSVYDHKTKTKKDIMAYPVVGLGSLPKDMKYRFNWNAPLVAAPHDPGIIYHAANVVLRTDNGGQSWTPISGDLTRNDPEKQGKGGGPYTNEGAGGENYNTISYMTCSPHQPGVIWTGSDDGLVHLTQDEGKTWANVTPKGLGEALINAIEVSPHDPATAYVVATKYRFNDFTPLIFRTTDFGKTWILITEGIEPEDFVRVVRADRKKPGLLYAGTETGLYLSFDNGALWHRFQNNLPVCPITDLALQDNDLIAATSGRGFWILDDLSVLQQSQGWLANGEMRLFQPKETVRIASNAPAKPVPGIGQNPLPGLIIDYYLPQAYDTLELTLEILDESGQVIRDYSNQKDKTFKRYEGGPKPEAVLPAEKGINRFNWDLKREAIPHVPGVFVLGDYSGGMVAPGRYSLRLSSPDGTLETQAVLVPDPRLAAEPAAFEAQQQILLNIEKTVTSIHDAVNEMRNVRQQMENINKIIAKMEEAKDLKAAGEQVVERISAWERNLIQPDQKTFQDVINFPNQLNAELLDLKSRVDTHEPTPTAGARARLNDLLAIWQQHKQAKDEIIRKDVAAFNRLYAERGIPALYVPGDEDKP